LKKILHIIESLGVGGAEKLLIGIINGLDGFEHHLIILDDPENLRNELPPNCAYMNLKRGSKFDMIFASGKVKKYIKENRIDIVHAHLYRANILSRLSTPRPIPLFNSIHAISSQAAYNGSRLTLYIERMTYRKKHHIIAVSKEVLTDFDKYVHIKGPATVLYNFVDERFFAGSPKTDFSKGKLRLVAVGNLRHQKNYPYLLEAFRSLPPEVSLDVYGDGVMRDELQRTIDEHKLNIRLHGLEKNLHRLLPGYDAFVMSSFFEGQPLSLLEAMAAGLPSILADIPVLREVTGNDAVYFDINDPQSLGLRIKEILESRIELGKLAAASHQRVNEFAHQAQYFQKLKKLYEKSDSYV
jgi:glycosyltransferase involved in cell wall biosynthesis